MLQLTASSVGPKKVTGNAGASLWDLGDGVFGLEFHSKMNTIDDDLGGMIELGRFNAIADDLMHRYLEDEVQEIVFFYTRFVSTLSYKPTRSLLLPLKPEEGDEPAGASGAPPLTKKRRRPPTASATFTNTSRSAMRYWRASSPVGSRPDRRRSATRSATWSIQAASAAMNTSAGAPRSIWPSYRASRGPRRPAFPSVPD